jgi:hypothetical protein
VRPRAMTELDPRYIDVKGTPSRPVSQPTPAGG